MQGIGKFGDIIKFKKGSRVEVLRKTYLSSCAWRCGEIISGNGQTYRVRYDGLWGLSNEDDVETVSREVIRPCPPPADVSDGWAVGDLVEVFDDLCSDMVMVILKGQILKHFSLQNQKQQSFFQLEEKLSRHAKISIAQERNLTKLHMS